MNWQRNIDIGIKAYLVAFIPMVFGLGGAKLLGLYCIRVGGGLFVALMQAIGLAIMVWILNRQKAVKSGRRNVILTLLLLLLPILVALVRRKRTDRALLTSLEDILMAAALTRSTAACRPGRLIGIQPPVQC